MNRQMFNALCAQYATPEVSGDGLVSWEHGKKCVIPSVKLYGAAVQDGEPTPENPVMPVCNNGVFTAYYDGGQAQAPELWAIPGTEYRDEWDPQTGLGVRRVAKVTLDGSEEFSVLKDQKYSGSLSFLFPTPNGRRITGSGVTILSDHWVARRFLEAYGTKYGGIWWSGDTNRNIMIVIGTDLIDQGITDVNAWKSWLSAQYAAGTPVTVWYAINGEPFYHPPAKLTMPTGYGQIIQVSGDVPDCPISAKYLTHS